jgi:hypothetical protein
MQKKPYAKQISVLKDALRILANDIQSDDGIANSVVSQAANVIDDFEKLREKSIAVIEWYYRDGSVGGAVDPMDELRQSVGVSEDWLRRK